jgi:hypothetical protein
MRLNFNQQKTSSMLNTLWFLVEYALVSGWIPGGFCSLLNFCAFGTIWNEIEKDFLNENERTIFEWEGFGRRWEDEAERLRGWSWEKSETFRVLRARLRTKRGFWVYAYTLWFTDQWRWKNGVIPWFCNIEGIEHKIDLILTIGFWKEDISGWLGFGYETISNSILLFIKS